MIPVNKQHDLLNLIQKYGHLMIAHHGSGPDVREAYQAVVNAVATEDEELPPLKGPLYIDGVALTPDQVQSIVEFTRNYAAQAVDLYRARNPKVGQPYGIVDPDYARVYTQARAISWSYGYTCVMHGSFTRDLDLLLVPWTDTARNNHEQLLKLIAQSCDLRFRDGKEDVVESKVDFSDKPHGRKSCSLYFPAFGDRRWVDISVLPATEKVPNPE